MKSISKIAAPIISRVEKGVSCIGRQVQEKGSFVKKTNNFLQGEGINPGHGAFLALVSVCTVVPRYLNARDDDERREILTRDITTILTIVFAMKGMKGLLSRMASKKNGLVLIKDNAKDAKNPLKRAIAYFKNTKDISALSSADIKANYTNINSKDVFVRMLEYVDGNKGQVGKVMTFDRKAKGSRPLTEASKKLLGEDYDFTKKGSEIIEDVKKISEEHEGFKGIFNVLKNDKNPLANAANAVNAWFETFSLGVVVGFVGFGLPKINETLTKSKYYDKDGLRPGFENPTQVLAQNMGPDQRIVFQSFLGNAPAKELDKNA